MAEKTKPHEWILVGLAALAVFDLLYIRHRSIALAEKLAKEKRALPPELETSPLSGAGMADRYLCSLVQLRGVPRN